MARLNWYGQPLKYEHFLLCPKRSVLIGQGSSCTPINEVEQSLRRDQSFEAMEQAVLSLSLSLSRYHSEAGGAYEWVRPLSITFCVRPDDADAGNSVMLAF